MSERSQGPSVSAIVLAYGDEPWLEACINALLGSDGLRALEVILVDNGCTDGSVERVEGRDGVVTLRPGSNLGFSGGCNLGASRATGEVLAFINSDAIAAPEALHHLATAALEPGVGISTGSIRLADAPETLNSGGNEVHLLGIGWAGEFGAPASSHTTQRTVTSASGAGMAMARATWDRIGGFEDRYFAYHEDADLSIRSWQQGLSVLFVPDAVVVHHYEFSRNANKFYLLERNRLIFVLTLYEARTLLFLAPLLMLFEAAVLAMAIRGGWGGKKIAGWAWLFRNRQWVRDHRHRLQAARTVGDDELTHLFSTRLSSGHLPLPGWLHPVDAIASAYLNAVGESVRRPRRHRPGLQSASDRVTPCA